MVDPYYSQIGQICGGLRYHMNKTTQGMFGFFPVGPGKVLPRDASEDKTRSVSVDKARILSGIHRSAGYLIRSTTPSGRFVYLRDLDPRAVIPRKYNIVRHAGAMFALAQYSGKFRDRAALNALIKASYPLTESWLRPLPDRPDTLAIWSDPPRSNPLAKPRAKLGAAGLGLLALSGMTRLKPNSFEIEDLERLANFILYMQREDGSFQSGFEHPRGQAARQWDSLYYPGEAALGLIDLYEISPRSRWLEAADKALLFLAQKRKGRLKLESDHWALMAIARRFSIRDQQLEESDQRTHIDHAALICRSILWDKPLRSPGSTYYGSMTRDGRICPTASRLEGLISALGFIPKDMVQIRRDIRYAIADGILFLMANQITRGQWAGAFPRDPSGKAWFESGGKGAHPGAGATEIRIDYAQHGLNALMLYRELLGDPGA